jgi:hypothetical protein
VAAELRELAARFRRRARLTLGYARVDAEDTNFPPLSSFTPLIFGCLYSPIRVIERGKQQPQKHASERSRSIQEES